MSNQIVQLDKSNSFIQQLGGPQEREYMMEVFASVFNIPANHSQRPDVVALMGKAIEKTVRYGWQAGTHMHVVPYKNKKTGETTYTLMDGEKGWWDSAARWRMKGVHWAPDWSPMEKEELVQHTKGIGLDKQIAANAYGIKCRILVKSELEIHMMTGGIKNGVVSEEIVPWSEGAYTGFKKAGPYWFADSLPTGVTASQVARRRAGKLAIMQSSLSLIPLNDASETDRLQVLTNDLKRQAEQRHRDRALIVGDNQVFEDDNGMMWATSQEAKEDTPYTVIEDDMSDLEENAPIEVELSPKDKLIVSINEFGDSLYKNWPAQKAKQLEAKGVESWGELSLEKLQEVHAWLSQKASVS